jgi:uncharacterized protein YutE (UPF0331/DUF86 family)
MRVETMTTRGLPAADRRLYEIADEYKLRGYKVTISPSPRQLPEFLRHYEPDLIAEGPDDSVVVEFKSRRKASEAGRWAELARMIQQHPGWRLDLVLGGERQQERPVTIDRTEIERRLKDATRLASENRGDAALLLTWSAAEAAMRLASREQEVDLPDYRPATVITRLYSDGIIDREDYDLLMQTMRLRNAVAHGFRHEAIDEKSVEQLRQIARRLLRAA